MIARNKGLIAPFEGAHPQIAEDAFVADTAAVMGNVRVGAGASIWYHCVLRGDVNTISIGRNTNIQDGTIIHCNHDSDGSGGDPTHVGDNVTVGHLALIHACTIEDDAFIGMRAVVMDNAVVERRAMVAGGAVVTPGKIVEAGQLWAGSPAKYMRDLTQADFDHFKYLTDHYVELATRHRKEQAAGS